MHQTTVTRALCALCQPLREASIAEEIEALHRAGWDGFFTHWEPEHTAEWAALARERGMLFQSVHAPQQGISSVWAEGEDGERMLAVLTEAAEDCARNGIPILVSHAWLGFQPKDTPTEIGCERIGRLADFCRREGIRLALENTEGIGYLAAALAAFPDDPALGFCYDSGHENCYTTEHGLLHRFGGRLIATHLNDNLGISDPGGQIAARDDLHLLPGDGNVSWTEIGAELRALRYNGALTFELKRRGQPDRAECAAYDGLTLAEFYTFARERAVWAIEKMGL